MTTIENIINTIKKIKYEFCNEIFINEIKNVINSMFPNLNNIDVNVLHTFSTYLINKISIEHFFENRTKFYMQWKSNNNRDIKSIVLMLLPFIDDNPEKKLFNKLKNLQELLYINGDKITKDILLKERSNSLKQDFKFGNFALGLFPHNLDNLNVLLDLKKGDNDDTLIHTIIHHNFISLVQTIKIVANKLYVNWINIQPLSIENYKQSKLYLTTNNTIKQLRKNIENNELIKLVNLFTNYKGLYLGDYYNTFRIDIYQNMKKIKWILFNIEISNNGIYMIQHLDKILDLSNVLNKESYDQLKDSEKNLFKYNFKNLINNLKNNLITYKIKNCPINDNYEFELNICKNLIAFFINNYKYAKKITSEDINKFKIKEFENDIESKDYDKKSKKIDDININTLINSMNYIFNNYIEYIWDYLKITLEHLKQSFYSEFLLVKNEDNLYSFTDYYYYKSEEGIEKKINLKNIYNIAKSLSHEETTWKLLPENYISLDINYIVSFFNKIFNVNNSWLSLKTNLSKQLNKKLSQGEYSTKINQITSEFTSIWNQLVWKSLIKKGILSSFEVNLDITDESKRPKAYNDSKKYIWNKIKESINNNKKNFENSYYYLTNQKYKEINNLRLKNFKETKKNYKYLDTLTNKTANQLWYTFYAMDWLAQINFFNHYINHQIIFVSGSTGTGKSTQVPKLIMYALKMYDYKNNGKIICTQPRIPPTENNTVRISEELGVPIKTKSKTLIEDVNTNNYYLQYKHSESNHKKDNTNHLQLKMTTDGTLVNELLKNPIMKEQVPNGKIIDGISDYNYGRNNKYDVIIVDEAHEHNTNMDIILTLTRNTCFYNNSVKLVIISATMDADEPTYRSYFRPINDNLVYPLKRDILHPITNTNFTIYSIYLDRKFHISPPGKTTLFTITDVYHDDIKFTNNDNNNSIIAQKESYKLIIDICNRTTNGQILLFSIGEMEIIEATKYLNNKLPESIIAIPYFGRLHPKYKEIISDIDNQISKIRNKKNEIYKDWGSEFKLGSQPEGFYNRAVIIATNVAEASITIPNLKFVIDNGYAKVNKYDQLTETTNLIVEKISESSRIQRRGRVGRISSGIVHYMYPKNDRKNIKPKYKITQEDFSNNFIKLSNENENLLWYEYLNIYYYPYIINEAAKSNLKFVLSIAENNPDYKKTDLYKKKIWTNMNHQFLLLKENNSIYEYSFPDDSSFQKPYFDIDPNEYYYLERFTDGYNTTNLIDEQGKFYIIHPKENKFHRNIVNNIIEIKKNIELKEIYLPIKKYDIYSLFIILLKNIQYKMLYINKKGSNIENLKNIENEIFLKTKFSTKINELNQDIILSSEEITTLIIGKGYNILNEVTHIIAMIKTVGNSISNLAMKGEKYLKFEEFYQVNKNDQSDLIAFYNIIKNFQKEFIYLHVFQLNKESSIMIKKYKKYYKDLVKEFVKHKYTFDPNPKNKTFNSWNILNNLNNNNKLDSGFFTWFDDNLIKNSINKNIKKHYSNIDKWCRTNFINTDIFIKYLNNYQDLALKILRHKKDYDDKLDNKSTLEWISNLQSLFNKSLTNQTIEEKIINSFLFGYSKNIAIKLNFDNQKYNLFSGTKAILPTIGKYKNTLCSTLNGTLFYINLNTKNNNKINILTKINNKKLSILLPILYNSKNIKNIYLQKDLNNKYKLITFNGNNYDNLLYNTYNNHTFKNFILNNNEFPNIQAFIKLWKKQNLK